MKSNTNEKKNINLDGWNKMFSSGFKGLIIFVPLKNM